MARIWIDLPTNHLTEIAGSRCKFTLDVRKQFALAYDARNRLLVITRQSGHSSVAADTIPRASDTVSKERSPMMKRILLHMNNPLDVVAGAHNGRRQPQIMRYVPEFPSANALGWAIAGR